MNPKTGIATKTINSPKPLLAELTPKLLDPLARELANHVEWWTLPGLMPCTHSNAIHYPVVNTGEGSLLLLLHGFDSSFLEFRRLAPLLSPHHQLVIPDLYGFGFCPRPTNAVYGAKALISHLDAVLAQLPTNSPVGVIGASMGGALAIEIARRHPKQINRLLLLSPAGLTGRQRPVPPPLDQLGVWFLSQPGIRRAICRQAFADPKASVGKAEEQIASVHLKVTGWRRSLAAFARSGGVANCGAPLPQQPLHVIWGANDRILNGPQRRETFSILGSQVEELDNCGHLPHLDHPQVVAHRWLEGF